jgi:hypothetical protein
MRNATSGILQHMALVRTKVQEESITVYIRMTRIGELGTTLAVTSNRSTLQSITKFQKGAYYSSTKIYKERNLNSYPVTRNLLGMP